MDMKFILASLLQTPIDANNTKIRNFMNLKQGWVLVGDKNIYGAYCGYHE
jgi:hypothetical protein